MWKFVDNCSGFMFCYMGCYCSLVLEFKVFEVVKWLGGIC